MTQKRFLKVVSRKTGTVQAYSVAQLIHYTITKPNADGFRSLRIMHERRPIGEPQCYEEGEFDISDFLNELGMGSSLAVTEERQVEI